jgi:hypothetical protein
MLTRRQTLILLSAAGAGTVFALTRGHSSIATSILASTPTPMPTQSPVMGLATPVNHGDDPGGCAREEFAPDREVELSLSDGMKRQHWTYGERRYVDESERVVMNEGEKVLLTLHNDTGVEQLVRMDGKLTILPGETQLAAGEKVRLELTAKQLDTLTLSTHGATRIVEVRPSYRNHV